jgi:hypothetical protein
MLTKNPGRPAFIIPSLGYIVVAGCRSRQTLTVIGSILYSYKNFFINIYRISEQLGLADRFDEFHRDNCVVRAQRTAIFVAPQRSGAI